MMQNHRKNLGLLLLPLMIYACSSRSPELPIPEDDLSAVLVDVYVAEARAEALGASIPDAQAEALRAHGYSQADLEETVGILVDNPEIAKSVFQTVLDSVIVEQRALRARALKDSL